MSKLDPEPFFAEIPKEGGWIAPWLAGIVESIQDEQSPFLYILEVQRRAYYPELGRIFCLQLWILVALLSFSIVTISFAIALRFSQGRVNLFVRLDRTVVLPSSLLFPICALVHATLGIVVVVGAHKIAKSEPYPIWFQGVKGSWIAPLWTGIFCELWACFSAWYIRRYGPHYRESRARTAVAIAIPVFVVLLAWVPSATMVFQGAVSFNTSVRWARKTKLMLEGWQAQWVPEKGLELDKIAQLFEPGGNLGEALRRYSERSSCASRYITVVLVATLWYVSLCAPSHVTSLMRAGNDLAQVYLTGACLELSHLSSTIERLRSESEVLQLASSNRRSQLPRSNPASAPGPGYQSLEEKLDNDLARSQGKGIRQWKLLEWTRKNRIMTTVCISAMLVQNAGFHLWKGVTPLTLQTPSVQFRVDILVSCWTNSLLSTAVAVLLLFRSLDGSSPLVVRLKVSYPLLPLPPSLDEPLQPRDASLRKGPVTALPRPSPVLCSVQPQAVRLDEIGRESTCYQESLDHKSKSSERSSNDTSAASSSKFGSRL
ncbi:hypothetical protein JCM11491_003838 [Sporobolomyces phaffii]